MSAFSTYLENLIIEATLRNGSISGISSRYLALFTDVTVIAELEASDFTNEVSGASYIRKSVNFDIPVDGVTQNTADIVWPTALENWGTIGYAAVCDTLANGTGNILYYGALSTPKVISTNDQFKFNAGDYDITVD